MRKIKLHGKHGKGKFALIDDEDYPIVSLFKWRLSIPKKNYCRVVAFVYINEKTIQIRLHTLITKNPLKKQIDHRNRNGLDNRKYNLRFCTVQQNNMNREPLKGKSSKYKGVHRDKRRKKWIMNIYKNYKLICKKRFATEKEAALKYNELALKHHGEFAYLNKIDCI